jgi:hypothetical protein
MGKMTAIDLLQAAGWTEVKSRRHHKYRCPCGLHQVSFPKTPSDTRGDRNTVQDIVGTGCPSIEKVLHPTPVYPWPEGAELKCKFCGDALPAGRFKKDWVHHDGVFACLRHHGIEAWSKEQRRKMKIREVADALVGAGLDNHE